MPPKAGSAPVSAKLEFSHRVENAPSGWDSWWRGRIDSRGFGVQGSFSRPACASIFRWASFLERESLVQNLPDQAAKPVGNHAGRLMVPEAQPIASIEYRENAI